MQLPSSMHCQDPTVAAVVGAWALPSSVPWHWPLPTLRTAFSQDWIVEHEATHLLWHGAGPPVLRPGGLTHAEITVPRRGGHLEPFVGEDHHHKLVFIARRPEGR